MAPSNDPIEDSVAPGTSAAVGDAASRVIDETPGPNLPPVIDGAPVPSVDDAASEGLHSIGEMAERLESAEKTLAQLAGVIVKGGNDETPITPPTEVTSETMTTISETVEALPWTHRPLFGKRR